MVSAYSPNHISRQFSVQTLYCNHIDLFPPQIFLTYRVSKTFCVMHNISFAWDAFTFASHPIELSLIAISLNRHFVNE